MHQSLFNPFNLSYIVLGNLILRNFQHLSFRFGSYTPTHNHTIIFSKLTNKSCILVPFLKHTAIYVWDCELAWNFHLCRVSFRKHWQIDHKHFFLQDKWMKTFTNLIASKIAFQKSWNEMKNHSAVFFCPTALVVEKKDELMHFSFIFNTFNFEVCVIPTPS